MTFLGDQNKGDQVLITGEVAAAASYGEEILISKLVSGRRAGGNYETQIITILASDSVGTNVSAIAPSLGGFFKLSFNESAVSTAWLPVTSSGSRVARALAQLSTMRAVTVTRSEINTTISGVLSAGYEWFVTFSGDFGNQPVISLDSSYVTTTLSAIVASVSDGDNELSATGSRSTNAVPGELPANYRSAIVGADARTYKLTGLVPGSQYNVQVDPDSDTQPQSLSPLILIVDKNSLT